MKDKGRSSFVEDRYFEEGNWSLKVWQTFFAIIMWVIVIIPVFITAESTWLSSQRHRFIYWEYREGKVEVTFLDYTLLICFIGITIFTVIMTIYQNRRFARKVRISPLYNATTNKQKEAIIEQLYTERFGSADYRKSVRFYSVKEKQNLDTYEIYKRYVSEGIDMND
ncbi:hypothetical protein [Listeria valentina]|uniref:hypothetical protein n=1 Tax=Listeria valentina TaxID=2705293 RepID=UPI001430CEFD|nr:hypothetical protein [Listeria valentina]